MSDVSVNPFATMRARASVPLLRRTHLLCMMFFRCSGVSVSVWTSV